MMTMRAFIIMALTPLPLICYQGIPEKVLSVRK